MTDMSNHDEPGSAREDAARLLQHFKVEEDMRAAYKRVFIDNPDGRIVFADLAKRSGFLDTATVPGDPFMTHFNDGRATMFRELVDILRMSMAEIFEIAKTRTPEELQRAALSEDE